jgi:D-lactate dehydrogenase (cytochrome)
MATQPVYARLTALRDDLVAIVGASAAVDDAAALALHSEDIWYERTHSAALIVKPTTTDQLQKIVMATRAAGFSIAPRGAGMSYTGGYVPTNDHSVSLDLSAMNRVLAISPEDMTVTVEAGCSWATLSDALAPHGLRTPFWGPMSGIYSTIGGGVSQLNAMFGAGHHGTSSESVIAMTIVLGDGSLIRTGARGPDGDTPFYRHFGPDLAGIFCGDCGVFGIKAEITLRLMRLPKYQDHASFAFATGKDLLGAMAEMARAGIASELCAFDPGLTKVRMARMSLTSDIKTLGAVVGGQSNMAKGLFAAAKIALGGRDFIEADTYPLHVIAEGRSDAGVADDMATARAIAKRFGGAEIENSIAKILRAMPFPAPNSILGPQGESWAPVHGHVSLSNAPAMFADIQTMFATHATEIEKYDVHIGFLFTSLSTNAITIEPVFYWPHGYRAIHESMVEPGHLARLPKLAANAEATALVAHLRSEVINIAARYGCAHFQIGRTYPYRNSRDAASQALLDTLKAALDPDRLFNPGGLGFAP